EGLHGLYGGAGEFTLDDVAILHCGEVIFLRPASRAQFAPHILNAALLEGQELGIVVLEIGISDAVEIISPDIDRQVRSPILLRPFPYDLRSGAEASDLIRPAAKRRFQRWVPEITFAALGVRSFPPV